MSNSNLSVLDYALFIATLVLSLLIGIYHGCFGNRQKTLSEYLWGNKKMRIIPVAVSLAVSHFSGTTLLVFPAETYRYGSMILWTFTGHIIMAILAIYFFLPVFFDLRLTSVYEYLEKRFNRKIRIVALVFYVAAEILQLPFHVYIPSLIFSTASGFNFLGTTLILTGVCIIYTTLGGLKTVVWTDVFQFSIVVFSLGFIYFVGFSTWEDFSQTWQNGIEGQRLQLFNFGFDLTQRDNFWGCSLGFGILLTSAIAVHQTGIQKFLALPNYKDCIWALFYNVISMLVVYIFCVLIGLKMFWVYKNCDPYLSKQIQKHDQILPFYITETAANFSGISGLFIAAVCSASLSSMSSNLNALSGVVYKDIFCLLFKKIPSEKTSSTILRIIVVCIGIFTPILVSVISQMDDILSLFTLVSGSTKSPLLGIFTLGILFPQTNSHGAICGVFLGFLSVLAISIPAKIYQFKGLIKIPNKPLSVSGCNITNATHTLHNNFNNNEVPAIFRISFYYYPVIGVLATVFFGLIISYLTGKEAHVDENLLSPVTRRLLYKKSQKDEKGEYTNVALA